MAVILVTFIGQYIILVLVVSPTHHNQISYGLWFNWFIVLLSVGGSKGSFVG